MGTIGIYSKMCRVNENENLYQDPSMGIIPGSNCTCVGRPHYFQAKNSNFPSSDF